MSALTLVFSEEMSIPIRKDETAFACATLTLHRSEYIAVQEGDVLGVYLPILTSGILHPIGEGRNASGLYSDQRGPMTSFNERTVTSGDLKFEENLELHLSADIGNY